MSRSDNRRGNRRRGDWSRENKERDERGGRNSRNERGDRRDRTGYQDRQGRNRSERNERSSRSERGERRGYDAREGRRSDRRFEGRQFTNPVSQKEILENENAIREFKSNVPVCEICGQPITDVASAISNKGNGNPVHFDCVLNKIAEAEKTGPNEKISYIGQGKFAVICFENPHDTKHFTIRKTIEWEERDQERGEWRNEMAGLFSQVK